MSKKRMSIDDATPEEWDALGNKPSLTLKINSPPHYNNGSIECIEYLIDNMGREGASYYCEGNVKKYMHRWRLKHDAFPIDDLKKARWYLDKLIELQS